MQFNSNYTIPVPFTEEEFETKEVATALLGGDSDQIRQIKKDAGYTWNKTMSFKYCDVNPEMFRAYCINGKTYCNPMNPIKWKDKAHTIFSTTQKTIENFAGTYILSTDIDETKVGSAREFINLLPENLKPTVWYTSYNNHAWSKKRNEWNGARFRMIYFLEDKMEDKYMVRYCYHQLIEKLSSVLPKDTVIAFDNCGQNCAQYFNGTNKNLPKFDSDVTNYIYTFEDFDVTEEGYIEFLKEGADYEYHKDGSLKSVDGEYVKEIIYRLQALTGKYYDYSSSFPYNFFESTKKSRYLELAEVTFNSYTERILSLFGKHKTDFDTFKKYKIWKITCGLTPYVYRVEPDNWIYDCFQYAVKGEYYSLKHQEGKFMPGDDRKAKIYERMLMRKHMRPDLTPDQLVVNMIRDIIENFDNSDCKLDEKYVEKTIRKISILTKDEAYALAKPSIDELLVTRYPKTGLIFKNREMADKYEATRLDKEYNRTLTPSQNQEIFKANGFEVGLSTIYRFCEKKNINTCPHKPKDDEIIRMLDPDKNRDENREILRNLGITCNNTKLGKLLKKAREIKANPLAGGSPFITQPIPTQTTQQSEPYDPTKVTDFLKNLQDKSNQLESNPTEEIIEDVKEETNQAQETSSTSSEYGQFGSFSRNLGVFGWNANEALRNYTHPQ